MSRIQIRSGYLITKKPIRSVLDVGFNSNTIYGCLLSMSTSRVLLLDFRSIRLTLSLSTLYFLIKSNQLNFFLSVLSFCNILFLKNRYIQVHFNLHINNTFIYLNFTFLFIVIVMSCYFVIFVNIFEEDDVNICLEKFFTQKYWLSEWSRVSQASCIFKLNLNQFFYQIKHAAKSNLLKFEQP